MDGLLEGFRGHTLGDRSAGVFPLINITENQDAYTLRAELPGIKAEDLDITVTGNSISISGERKIPDEDLEAKYHRRERDAGKFSRVLSLAGQIDPSKVEANTENGVLTIVLPKAEAAKPQQIAVKSA
jgi:HSP20 family protein